MSNRPSVLLTPMFQGNPLTNGLPPPLSGPSTTSIVQAYGFGAEIPHCPGQGDHLRHANFSLSVVAERYTKR